MDGSESDPAVIATFKKLLSDEPSCDLVIKVGSESVNAHAAVVACRCEEIIGFPQDEKSKKKKKHEVKLKGDGVASSAIMGKVLEFLYTGVVDFPKLSDKDILQVIKAARFFKLDRLSYLCECWLIQHMTIESVFHLLRDATELKEERIKGFCMRFALQNYNSFISNKDGIYILGIELFQEVVAAFQTNPPVPDEISPEKAPRDTLITDLKKLHDQMPYSDSSIMIGNQTLRFHRAVIAACSESLANAMTRDPDAEIRISANAMTSVLKFCYYGDSNVDPLPACELVGFCRKFNIPTLLVACEDRIRKSIDHSTALAILAVSYLPSDGKKDLVDELRGKCIPFILENMDQIDFSRIKAYNPMMIVDLLLELQQACNKGSYGLGNLKVSGDMIPKGSGSNLPKSQLPPPNCEGIPVSREPSGGLLGAQRNRPPPPPRANNSNSSNLPPPSLGVPPPPSRNAPAPPPRDKTLPPPSLDTSNESSESNDPKGRLTRKKSQKDLGSELKVKKQTKKDKKEEEKRKKEEQKRIDKERKERSKMEKKFKGKGEIF